MVFDKIKEIFGGGDRDLGDVAGQVGLGEYSKYVEGISFPATKDEVLTGLNDNGAPDAIKTHVESLVEDRFNSAQDVFKTLLNR